MRHQDSRSLLAKPFVMLAGSCSPPILQVLGVIIDMKLLTNDYIESY